jgi:hypothetical protein
MKKIYSLLLALTAFAFLAHAQSQLGEIRGKVLDSKTKKPLDYASVTIELNGAVRATTLTDDDGQFIVKTLQPGQYTIKVTYTGYVNAVVNGVDVISDQIAFQNIAMQMKEDGKVLEEVVIKRKKPLVDPEGKGGATIGAKEIMSLPQRNTNMIANTVAGVDARAGGTPNIRGARADGTAYYIDGVRVQGGASTNIPQNAIDQIQIITGGTPAQYGDFIGGAIAINTKAPSRNWQGGFEYISASPFNGYLDNTQYNELQFYISGPLKIFNKGRGEQERILGFMLSGSTVFNRDGRPSAVDMYKVKDQRLLEMKENPLVQLEGGGFVPAGEYLQREDLERIDYRQNASTYSINAQGNFTYQVSKNTYVRVGYQGNMFRGRDFNFFHSLTNYDQNAFRSDNTFRTYMQLTQNFQPKKGDDGRPKPSTISNAYYTVRAAYEVRQVELMASEHMRDFFQYGYLGTFTNYNRPTFQRVFKGFGDSADVFLLDGTGQEIRLSAPYWRQVGFRDTLLVFNQADVNRVRGNYTRQISDFFNQNGQGLTSISQLRGLGGMVNGDQPAGIHSNLWASVGNLQGATYQRFTNEAITIYAMSEASVAPKSKPKAKHDLQFGVTFEQQFRRQYNLNANGLWTLMRILVDNSHIKGPDSTRAIINLDQNGVFQDTVFFRDLIDVNSQSNFDRNLRNKLIGMGARDANGRPIDESTRLNPNAYDPSMYSLDMFTADELLNNGNSFISYFGYDHLGNRVRGRVSIDQFLNDPDRRLLGAYQPIYTAAWVQDKFVFKDLIVRLGVRMERFDANQLVLKDPYSMAPVYTAGDVRRGVASKVNPNAIPNSIGDDYVVYVNNHNHDNVNQLTVTGFRQDNRWFDRSGNPLIDPSAIWRDAQSAGINTSLNQNIPYLVNSGQRVPDQNSFRDYTPDLKFLPRIWFSFPISTTSQLFGTYDVLAQRPTEGNIAQFDDFFFLSNRLNGVIANPNLRMTQVTDYEVGFRQQIGNDAALGIIASYREFRNLIQLFRYAQAWPFEYNSLENLDFSTVKSVRIEYELRELGNVNLSANYMLQFADGTGSNSSQSQALIQAGIATQRNIFPMDFDTRHTFKGIFDFRYRDGKDYNGPIVGGKKIFENSGFNLIFNAVSGRPFTQLETPIPEVQAGVAARSQVRGTINGARQPSQFFVDLNVDKNFMFKSQTLDGKTNVYRLRVFLWVQNLFDNVNALSVYRYTGSPFDDGFITSPFAQAQRDAATDAQSLVDLYNVRVVNPNVFALPRLTRIGLALYF